MLNSTGNSSYINIFNQASTINLEIEMKGVGSPLWSRLTYVNNNRMDCHDILYIHRLQTTTIHWIATFMFSSGWNF